VFGWFGVFGFDLGVEGAFWFVVGVVVGVFGCVWFEVGEGVDDVG